MASPAPLTSTVFSLAGLGLKLDDAQSLLPHIAPLSENPHITSIDLSGNTYGISACEALSTILITKKSLRNANLADIFTSRLLSEIPTALSHLLDALVTLPELETINLNDNAFGLSLIGPLVRFIESAVALRHLHLNNNGMGPIAGAQLAEALVKLHAAKAAARKRDPKASIPELETIICGRNRLETGSMSAWAEVFRVHTSMKIVRMTQNGIRMEGISLLLKQGLPHCRGLRVLDLQDNTFTAPGSAALVGSLSAWPELEELGVGDCLLGARGGNSVFQALAKSKSTKLRTLKLQYNELDTKSLKTLLLALKDGSLPSLRRAEINGNKGDPEGQEIRALHQILHERRRDAGIADEDYDEEGNEEWGLGELDEMESDDEDEDEDEEEEETAEPDSEDDFEGLRKDDEAEIEQKVVLREAAEAENEPVAQEKDADVDKLADELGKKATIS